MRNSDEFQKLLDKLSTYTYGILYNDGQFVTDKMEIDRRAGTDIIIQTPEMIDEHKSGMCHDASIYVDEELTKLNIPHKCVYITSYNEPKLPTYSFVLAFDEDTLEWIIIDIFASKNYIYFAHMFKDMNEAIEMRVASWIKDDNNGSPNIDVFILDHMPSSGIGFVEYYKKVVDSTDCYEFNRGYIHIDYEGVGVYQALKKAVGYEWKDILDKQDISWLPKPPDYNGGMKSYFTMKGYREFKQKVMPIIRQYLNEDKLNEEYMLEESFDSKNLVYSDEFQIIMKNIPKKNLIKYMNQL